MSKALSNFAQLAQNVKNAPSKFTGAAAEGSRLVPSKTKDEQFQFRIDAGHYDDKTKHLNVNLQINSQAKSPALKDFVRKNTTHEKVATATFDTTAEDKAAEYNRVVNELVQKGRQKLADKCVLRKVNYYLVDRPVMTYSRSGLGKPLASVTKDSTSISALHPSGTMSHNTKASRISQVTLPLICHPKRPQYIRPSVICNITSKPPFSKLGRMQFFTGRAMGQVTVHGIDPHSYTSGRWLRNDDHERHIRRIDFDFDELCRKVLGLFDGAKYIRNCEKKEGGFNRVFIFTLDDDSRAVARLPFTFAGPAKLTTASEVATIQYLQRNTSIPIPKILDWSDDAMNCVGSEYIVMEHVSGVQLHQKWPYMSGDQKVKCIDAIYRKLKEVTDIDFPAYGSLYFSTSPLRSFATLPIEGGFCLGPHCGTRYWNCGDGRYYNHGVPNHGPYSRVHDAAVPTLFHPDLHKRNIFVSDDDPTIITGIVDWQSSSIEPAFWYADEIPDFATCSSSSASSAPSVDDDLCTKAYEICTQFLTPRLARPRLMNEGLFRLFRYCYRTWKDGAVAFRHELIETSKDWEDLGLSDSCPFPLPDPEDADLHQKEYRRFEAAQNLKCDLSNLLDSASDGWVPPEGWEASKIENMAMFKGMLKAVKENKDPDDDEPIRNEGDLRDIWPFDLPEED
ncbi:hypothetical protein N7526_001787 [Penicillium atrosanguineum]|nr:hypothetical protein N7526_001787 [Penicillium atrosanguineum]